MLWRLNMTKDKKELFFDHVYDTYSQRIMSFLIYYFNDMDIAEEAFQETFIEAFRNIDSLKNHPNIGGWLIMTAKNKGHNIRSKKNRLSETLMYEFYAFSQSSQVTEISSLMRIDDPVFTDEKYKPLRLKYIYGYSVNEIADFYHIEQSACKMRLKRAKIHARKYLEKDI